MNSMCVNTTGCDNTAIGRQALKSNESAGCNIAIGNNTLLLNTTGCQNVAVGTFALDANTDR
jgi:trimeric autotransporter adhesin